MEDAIRVNSQRKWLGRDNGAFWGAIAHRTGESGLKKSKTVQRRMTMAEYPTVTISADEYFDLRSKAETNLFMTTQMNEFHNRIGEIEGRLRYIEAKVMDNG